ncbi:MAG TPA: hypothetical protein VJ939_07190, partial [Bacteroidales bacterium]|nr:hypothetical protein [Bacteroidales bacterium]
REFIKESYFIGGKQKFRRIYLIDGMPEEEFYNQNATDIDHLKNEEYWLISNEIGFFESKEDSDKREDDYQEGQNDELPF